MKAAILRRVGEPLEIGDVRLERPGPYQVRVRIAASGVCHSDASVRNGWIPYPLPTVLGHEGAGVVEEVGSAVTRVRTGDHVVLSWAAPCRACAPCLSGQPFLCRRGMAESFTAAYGTSGSERVSALFGTATFAEEALVLERQAVPIDSSIPLEVAALVGCAVTTGVGAVVNTARVEPGASVAVIGCGGVGLSVVMGARLVGAGRIVAIDRVRARLAAASELGATDAVDASQADAVEAVRALTLGAGADHAFEVVGHSSTIMQAFEMTRAGGVTTLVGAGRADDPVTFSAAELFGSAKEIRGCVYGSADPDRDFPRFLDLYRAGRLDLDRLVTRRIPLGEVEDAFRAMEAGEGVRTVIMF